MLVFYVCRINVCGIEVCLPGFREMNVCGIKMCRLCDRGLGVFKFGVITLKEV